MGVSLSPLLDCGIRFDPLSHIIQRQRAKEIISAAKGAVLGTLCYSSLRIEHDVRYLFYEAFLSASFLVFQFVDPVD
jgi:hypothetical protein